MLPVIWSHGPMTVGAGATSVGTIAESVLRYRQSAAIEVEMTHMTEFVNEDRRSAATCAAASSTVRSTPVSSSPARPSSAAPERVR